MLYLDNSATTPVHPAVKNAMLPYLLEEYGNPSSKYYSLAINAKEAVENARKSVAALLDCRTDEIIFTSGSTESNNFIIKGITDQLKSKGKHIITTAIEHPSVLEVCKYLEKNGFDLTILNVNKEGRITIEQVKKALRPDTILITVQWGNNEIGSLNPIEDIAKLCEKNEIFFHSDATQIVGKIPIHLSNLPGLKAISISAHKFFGPKGIGAVYLKRDEFQLFPSITPLLHGGGQEYDLRSGTLAVHNIVGMGKASEIALESLNVHISKLMELENYLETLLVNKFGSKIKFNHPKYPKVPGIISVQFLGVNNEILVKKLAPFIAVSTGSACSSSKPSYVLTAIGLTLDQVRQTIRISLSPYISKDDLEVFNSL